MREHINKAAKELEHFKTKYSDPLNARVDKARGIMEGWDDNNITLNKEVAQAKFIQLDAQNIDFLRYYHAVNKMIEIYDKQMKIFTEMYTEWFRDISVKGVQPREMMDLQAKKLDAMFERIKEVLNEIDSPK
jgi:hypothetical protein